MSYSNFGWGSDLYVYATSYEHQDALCCASCLLSDEDGVTSYFSLNTEDMIDHIRQHQKAGHEVPVDLIELLKDDDESNFPSEEDM